MEQRVKPRYVVYLLHFSSEIVPTNKGIDALYSINIH